MRLGAWRLVALLDGTLMLPLDTMFNHTTPEWIRARLAANFLPLPVPLSANAFLLDDGTRRVLIDTGSGTLLGPTLGLLPASLRAAGYAATDIDDVILTHIHADHSGGLSEDGRPCFPRARLHVGVTDAGYWLDEARRQVAPPESRRGFDQALASVEPYRAAGRLSLFENDAPIVPGIRAVLRPGHTPGHNGIRIESEGHVLMAWGDIVHGDVVQFADPGIGISFDLDSEAAIVTRRLALAEAAAEGCWIAGAHLPFPGIGHVRREGKVYGWVPTTFGADA